MPRWPYVPAPQCRCGIKFTNNQELRIHIALMAMDYPRIRCTQEHHDPKSEADVRWLKQRETSDEDTDND